jgi:hypothetical protein
MDEVNDTSPAVQHLLSERLRAMPAWRKLELVGQMNRTVDTLALSGLRQRHPGASPAELRRRLADLRLGATLARRVYGPFHPGEEP